MKEISKILILSTICIFIAHPSISDTLRLLMFISLSLYSINRIEYILFIIGFSNVIPFFGNISPMQVILFFVFLKVMISIIIKKIRIAKILSFTELKILYLLLIWTTIAAIQGDFLVFVPLLLGVVTTVLVIALLLIESNKFRISLFYFLLGVYNIVIVGYLSLNNLFGFSDIGFNRLTLFRGDPNSLALMIGYISVFIAAYLIGKIFHLKFYINDLLLIIPLLLSINLHFLTGSRGSFISFIVAVIISFIILFFLKKRLKNDVVKKYSLRVIINAFILIFVLFIFILNFKHFLMYIGNTYDVLFTRLFENANGLFEDDIRSYLLSKAVNFSFENPIFGVGINQFLLRTNRLPHNTYLDFLTSSGYLGLVIYLFYILKTLIRGIRKLKYRYDTFVFSLLLSVIFVFINTASYSAIGDKFLWVPVAFMVFYNKQIIDEDI